MSTQPLNTASLAPNASEKFAIDPDHSDVGFSVRHMLGRARGRFEGFSGAVELDRQHPEQSSISLVIDPASIDTRQPDRDAHLKSGDFFDVAHYPEVRFTSRHITSLGGERYRVEGVLELRGIIKPLTLEVSYYGVHRDPWGGERASFSTEAVLNRKEFGMVWNAALDNGGVILGDDVTVTIDLETVRQP